MSHRKTENEKPEFPIISSGSLRIDIALGSGGYPPGSLVEICGKMTSGKTALALHAIKEAQRIHKSCAFLDSDGSMDIRFARRIGVIIENLYYSDSQDTNQVLWTVEALAQSGGFSLIVVDSIVSMTPSDWVPGKNDDQIEITNNELMSSSLNRLARTLARSGTTLILLNDFKTSMSSVYHNLSRDPGRLTLKLLADIRIRLENQKKIIADGVIIGETFSARVLKNRYFPLLNMTDFDIIYQQGINISAEIFTLGIYTRLIDKSALGYFYQTIPLGKTSSQAILFLEGNKQVREDVEEEIRRAFLPENFTAAI